VLDYNAIADAILTLLGTATWTVPNTSPTITETFGQNVTRRLRDFEQTFANPSLSLYHHATLVQQPQAWGLQVERIMYQAWVYLPANADLSVLYEPDIYLTNVEVAVRNALNLRYPLFGSAPNYLPLEPGTAQSLNGLLGDKSSNQNGVWIEGTILRYDGSEGGSMVLVIPIVALGGNP
jgi:hypothetical protein